MKNTAVRTVVSFALAVIAVPAMAADWPSWRGPHFNGSTEATNLPTEFSATENVAWSVDMPGVSSATPAIADGRVYVVSNDAAQTTLFGMCIDAASGDVLWSKELVTGAEKNARNDQASCSPVTDGERVYFQFGNSDLFALDKDGNELWSKNLDRDFGPVATNWGYSSTPLLYNGGLYIQVLKGEWETDLGMDNHTDSGCYIVRLNPETGETVWKVHRTSDSNGESFDAYTSPVPYEAGGEACIAVMGGDYITGHESGYRRRSVPPFPQPAPGRFRPADPIAGRRGRPHHRPCSRAANTASRSSPRPRRESRVRRVHVGIRPKKPATSPRRVFYDGNLFFLHGVTQTARLPRPPPPAKSTTTKTSTPTPASGPPPPPPTAKSTRLTEKGQVVIAKASDIRSKSSTASTSAAPKPAKVLHRHRGQQAVHPDSG